MSSIVGHYAWHPKLPLGNSVVYAPGPMGVTITECDCHSVRLVWDTVFSPAFPGPGLWFGQENSLLLLTASAYPPSDTKQ